MVKVQYGSQVADVTNAAGVRGMLCRNAVDGSYFFRVYRKNGDFTDYELRHDELEVVICEDELASFYQIGEKNVLDHSPEVLGLKKENLTIASKGRSKKEK